MGIQAMTATSSIAAHTRPGGPRMTRADVARVMRQIPLLNDHGVGLFDGYRDRGREEREAIFQKDRDGLLRSEGDCTMVCRWLSDKCATKTINRRHSSYGLKHMAEEEIGYVTNGAFIAAAVHCGFPYRLVPGSPNVLFGLSEKSLKGRSQNPQNAQNPGREGDDEAVFGSPEGFKGFEQ